MGIATEKGILDNDFSKYKDKFAALEYDGLEESSGEKKPLNAEILKFEFTDALEEIQTILSLLDKNELTEGAFEVSVKHLLTHVYRGYNWRHASSEEWPGKSEQEYQKGIRPPLELFDHLDEPGSLEK